MAAHCFMHVFTDLGWREMDEAGRTDGARKPGFVWHTAPGCVLLPGDARICFLRCDDAACMLGEARSPAPAVVPLKRFLLTKPRSLHGSPGHSITAYIRAVQRESGQVLQ